MWWTRSITGFKNSGTSRPQSTCPILVYEETHASQDDLYPQCGPGRNLLIKFWKEGDVN